MSSPAANVTIDDDGQTLRVGGELDAFTAPTFSKAFDAYATDPSGTLTVNMADVTFIDSSALQVLVEWRGRCENAGGSLVIASPSAAVVRLFELAGLDRHFEVAE